MSWPGAVKCVPTFIYVEPIIHSLTACIYIHPTEYVILIDIKLSPMEASQLFLSAPRPSKCRNLSPGLPPMPSAAPTWDRALHVYGRTVVEPCPYVRSAHIALVLIPILAPHQRPFKTALASHQVTATSSGDFLVTSHTNKLGFTATCRPHTATSAGQNPRQGFRIIVIHYDSHRAHRSVF